MTRLYIVTDKGTPTLICRVCKKGYYDDERYAFQKHVAQCAEEYMERVRSERSRLNFLKPQDPEWEAYVQSGRYRPLTRPKPD